MKTLKRTALIVAVILFAVMCFAFTAGAEGEITEGGNNYIVTDEDTELVLGSPEEVTSTSTTSSITLNWTAVEGVTGYRVYYKTAKGWKKCATTTENSRTFGNLKAGSKFIFAVKAGKVADGKVVWADSYTVHETAVQAAAPAKVTAAQNENAIKLSWSACSGATGYRIYYKSGNNWKVAVSTTNKTSHTFTGLKSGSKYTFAVRPYIKLSDRVIWSNYTTYVAATKPAAAKASAVSTYGGSVTVSWSAVNGAEGYQLFYKVNNGSYKLYKVYSTPQKLTFNGLVKGAKYTFAIRAYKNTTGGYIFGAYKPVSATIAYKVTRYDKVFEAGTFLMVIDDPDLGDVTMAMKGNKMYVESVMEDMKLRLIFDGGRKSLKNPDGTWYLIIDDIKKYSIMPSDMLGDMDGDELIKEFSKSEKLSYKTSYAIVGGKKLECESAKDSDGNTLRYYFDGNTLVMSQTVNPLGVTETTKFKKITTNVPDSLFKIPSDYGYINLEWLMKLAGTA